MVTLIWFLTSEAYHICWKMSNSRIYLVVLAVLVWSFKSLSPHMTFKTTRMVERLVTLAKLIWFIFDFCMNQYMMPKGAISRKGIDTLTTWICFFASMAHHMCLKAPNMTKFIVT